MHVHVHTQNDSYCFVASSGTPTVHVPVTPTILIAIGWHTIWICNEVYDLHQFCNGLETPPANLNSFPILIYKGTINHMLHFLCCGPIGSIRQLPSTLLSFLLNSTIVITMHFADALVLKNLRFSRLIECLRQLLHTMNTLQVSMQVITDRYRGCNGNRTSHRQEAPYNYNGTLNFKTNKQTNNTV